MIYSKGLMSGQDKYKLDNIEDGANRYVLPLATDQVIGGTKLYSTTGNNIDGTLTQAAISNMMSGLYTYKGVINSYAELPMSNNNVGDTYNIATNDDDHEIIAGDNLVWNGNSWDKLAGSVNLSNYVKKNDTYLLNASVSGRTLTIVSSEGVVTNFTLPESFELPAANTLRLGGIRVGEQLAITPEGLLSVDLNNMILTGRPVAPTADAGDNTGRIATTAFVQRAIENIANISTDSIDMIRALTEELENGSVVKALNKQISQKVNKSGDTISGDLTVMGELHANADTSSFATYAATAEAAEKDVNGSSIVNYVKNVEVLGDILKITSGTGIVNEYPIVSSNKITISQATTEDSGLMSADDKLKLNGIAANANNYVLPSATTNSLGGIKIGTDFNINQDGVLLASIATENKPGIMKLYSTKGNNTDGTMTQQAINNLLSSVYTFKGSVISYEELPQLPDVGDTYNVLSNDSVHDILAGDSVTWNGTTWTKLANSVDLSNYVKVDDTFVVDVNIENNILNITTSTGVVHTFAINTDYTLPSATATTLGGIKVGSNLSVDEHGVLSVNPHNMVLTGTPTAITTDATDNSNRIATTKFVQAALSKVINTSTDTLAALEQIREMLDNNEDLDDLLFSVSNKLDKTGGTVTGDLTVLGSITGKINSAKLADSATVADTAIADTKGNNIHDYSKTVELIGNTLVVTTGAGSKREYSIKSATYNRATTAVDGLMSSEDKIKLNNISTGANKYELPIATSSVLGGVKIGNGITVNDNGVIGVATASNSVAGVVKLYSVKGENTDGTMTQKAISSMVSGVYTFKGSVDTYSNLPVSGNSVGDTYNILQADAEHEITAGDSVAWNGTAWATLAGSVNLSNYVKRDDTFIVDVSVADNIITITPSNGAPVSFQLANTYELPAATQAVLGGIKVGGNLSIDNEGFLSVDTTSLNMTGTPTAPTADISSNSTQVATTAFVKLAIADLIDTSEETLQALSNLSEAMADTSAISALTESIGTKLPLTGGTITGNLTIQGALLATATKAVSAESAQSATKAVTDASGNLITSYLHDFNILNDEITIADGAGNLKTFRTKDTTYNLATTTSAGLLSAEDKEKLNSIVTGANNYSLPVATQSTLGGIKLGDNISVAADGTASVTDTNIVNALSYTPVSNTQLASASSNGLMLSTDKIKLDTVEARANNYSLPVASPNTLGGIKVGSNITITNDGTMSLTTANVVNALGFTPVSDVTVPDTYAPKDSPVFTGIPTAPTVADKNNTDQIATTKYVDTAIANLLSTSTSAVETISELATAFENNQELTNTYLTSLGNKLDKQSGGTIAGNLTVAGTFISTSANSVVTKATKLVNARSINISDYDATNLGSSITFDGTSSGVIKLPSVIKATLDGTASLATKATKDINNQNITSYIKSVTLNGSVLSVTDGEGTASNLTLPNPTYSVVTSSSNGLMSAIDKAKLDTIAENANNYTLPLASAVSVGGVKVGSNLTVDNGTVSLTKANVLSALKYTPIDANQLATTNTNGLMSAVDKSKLDSIDIVALNGSDYVLPTADDTTLGGIKVGSGLVIDEFGVVSVPDATSSTPGLLKLYSTTGSNDDGVMTQQAVTNLTANTFKYKGVVSSYDTLPNVGLSLGDVYTITNPNVENNIVANDSVFWTGNQWLKLAGHVNLSSYVKTTDNFITDVSVSDNVLNVTRSNGQVAQTTLANDYTLLTATANRLGGVKVGTNLSVTGDGTISLNPVNIKLTGIPTAPTQNQSDNSTKIATTAFVKSAIADLTGTAPEVLSALDEIAEKLSDNSVVESLSQTIGEKLPISGGTITGDLIVNGTLSATVSEAAVAQSAVRATTAVNDDNGVALTSYVKNISSSNGKLVVTDGQGNVSEITPQSSYEVVTQSANGLMTASDKTKLDSIETGANYYELPIATSSSLGGIRVGDNLTNTSGTVSISKTNVVNALGYTPANSLITATEEASGLMSAIDKAKLNAIDIAANRYELPAATDSTLGGIKVGSGISYNNDTISLTVENLVDVLGSAPVSLSDVATNSTNGLLSAADKVKLDSVAIGANNYSLPAATNRKLGGIKVGDNLTVNESGVLSLNSSNIASALGYTPANASTIAIATANSNGLMSAADKAKLDDIASEANKYILTAATTTELGGVKIGENITNKSGVISVTSEDIASALSYIPADSADMTVATATSNGLMSAVDKEKLDGIDAFAKNFSLGAATANKLGGIKVGSNLTVANDGTLSINNTNVVNALGYTPANNAVTATSSTNGLMASTDKSKLDGIEAEANKYILPAATSSVLGGITVGDNLTINKGALSISNTNVTDALGYTPVDTADFVVATSSKNGLMSTSDRTKLDNIEAEANKYILPAATSASLGGVKVGNNITLNAGSISLSNTNVTSALGYTPADDAVVSSTYAPKASPIFTGTPIAPTAESGTSTTVLATTEFVMTALSDLIGTAPTALDTLAELADAINNDADVYNTLNNAIGTKLNLSGGTITGNLTVQGSLTAEASTATKLATARVIGITDADATNTGTSISFDGSNATALNLKLPSTIKANITGNATTSTTCTGNATTASKLAASINIAVSDATSVNTGTATEFDGSANVTVLLPSTIKATLTGNADTATKLKTARSIGITDADATNTGTSISFDGSNATALNPLKQHLQVMQVLLRQLENLVQQLM